MSQDHGAGHDTSTDSHAHDAFDPEPAQALGADEAPSPGWLPIVGAVLLVAGVGFLFYPGSDAIAKAPEAPSAVAAAPPVAAPPKGPLLGKRPPPKRPEGKGDKPLPLKGAIKKAVPTK